jgi:excinuclease ABC subunit B
MYADNITKSMRKAIDETNRRREIQIQYNKDNNITPETIIKPVRDVLRPVEMVVSEDKSRYYDKREKDENGEDAGQDYDNMTRKEIQHLIIDLEEEMEDAADNLEFEIAAQIRDEIEELESKL